MSETENFRYLQEKVQPVLAPIIEEVLRKKPEDKIAFFLQRLKELRRSG